MLEGIVKRERRRLWWVCLSLLSVISFVAYSPSFRGDGIWDDNGVLNGAIIGGGKSLVSCFTSPFFGHYYRPLVSASFFFELHSRLTHTLQMHLDNALVHVLTIWALAYLVLAAGGGKRLAVLAAALFAFQPCQVMTVSWISGRTDSLSCLFSVLFLWGLVRWCKERQAGWLGMACASFFAAILTKEQTAVLLLAVPFAEAAFGQRKGWLQRSPATAAPIAALAGLFGALYLTINTNPSPGLAPGIGAVLAMAGETAAHYAMLLVAPTMDNLLKATLETYQPPIWAVLGWSILASSVAGAVYAWKRNRLIGWFAVVALISYLPVANLMPVPSLPVSAYRLGCMGPAFAFLLAVVALKLFESRNKALGLVGAAYIAWGAVLSYGASTYLTDESTFFVRSHQADPQGIVVNQNLAEVYQFNRRWDLSKKATDEMLAYLFPGKIWTDPAVVRQLTLSDPMVAELIHRNQGDRAVPAEVAAKIVAVRAPDLAVSGDIQGAKAALEASVALNPRVAETWANLGLVYLRSKDPRWRDCFAKVLELKPGLEMPARFLAFDFEKQGRPTEAESVLRTALAANPSSTAISRDLAKLERRPNPVKTVYRPH